MASSGLAAVFLIILTVFLPPLGVFLITGCSVEFLISILLTILGYIPGWIYAFYIEYKYAKLDAEGVAAYPEPIVYRAPATTGTTTTSERIAAAPNPHVRGMRGVDAGVHLME
ncbi:UPF0057-domain-containing protein [Saitoella complicata NRRL Y-17804]|nr:UPF0057-domain-containing protein [Saitoella complicata NRRL Y-17804]ODQ54111.1 UPF0057-domain-containing protein [Saitoella complicata NRRL Y-17804]